MRPRYARRTLRLGHPARLEIPAHDAVETWLVVCTPGGGLTVRSGDEGTVREAVPL
jgi:hypothetical protein